MVINWALVTCLVIGFFAWSGLARGWWKEAITTVFLAILVFLLQQPDLALGLIDGLNSLISTIWDIIPASLQTLISDTLETFLGISAASSTPQISATDPGVWVIILLVVVAASTLIGRYSFNNKPTALGAFFGALMGGLNGFLVLNLVREYLDGRALPGQTPQTDEITMVGASAFGSASSTITLQATNLPSVTLLDSAIPWLVIGGGVLLAIMAFTTRVVIEKNKEGGARINSKKLPPFYSAPPPAKKPKNVEEVIDKLFK